jgi:hypothetical protein
MTPRRRLLPLLLTAVLGIARSATSFAATTPEIWFWMRGYIADPQKFHGVDGQQGWRKLFMERQAPLPPFMDHVQVVALVGTTLAAVPAEALTGMASRLKEKHIKLGMESLALSWVGFEKEHCGKGVESFTDPSGQAQLARKIKNAGGELAYVSMDEPLFNGRYYSGANACHDSIQTVAARAAAIMREYQKIFPDVVIGDTEPFPALTKLPHWQSDYKQWLEAFNQAVGKPITYLNIDINWPEDNWRWQQSLQEAVRFARENHLQVGIIYNAAFPEGARSDEQWLSRAVDNVTQIENRLHIVPDKALFESWAWFPKHSVSEGGSTGEDSLVKSYMHLHGVEVR